jgi:hypothetical protein
LPDKIFSTLQIFQTFAHGQDFSLRHEDQTKLESIVFPMRTCASFRGGKAAGQLNCLFTSIWRWDVHVSIPFLLHGAVLKTGDKLCFWERLQL